MIQTVPEYTAPTETAASFWPIIRLETPMGESLDCQLLPSAFSTAGARLTASGLYVSTEPLAPPGATSKTSGPTVEARAGRSAAL